jgi:hypothetical protein
MIQKVIRKETIEEQVSQGDLCENIYNLTCALNNLEAFDAAVFGEEDKLSEVRLNILLSIHFQSTHLQNETTKKV